jgi:hypothetical protein
LLNNYKNKLMKKLFIEYRRFCLTVLFLVIFAPALSVSVLNCFKIYNSEKENAQEQIMFLAKLTMIRQEQTNNEAREFLFLLSQLPQFKNSEFLNCGEFLTELLKQHKEYTDIALFGKDGNLICDGLKIDQSMNFEFRPYFQKMIKERGFVVGKYAIGAVSDKPVLPFIQPIFDDQGEIKSAVAVFRDLSWLDDSNSKNFLSRGTSLLIFDGNGIVLNCFSEEKDCVGKNIKNRYLAQKAIEKGDEGALRAEGLDGVEKNYFFVSLSPDSSQDKIYVAAGKEDRKIFATLFPGLLPNIVLLLTIAFLAWLVAKKECSSCDYHNSRQR